MSLTDPIANMLSQIKNAILAKKKGAKLPSSRMKVEIAKILKEEGYINNFKVIDDNKQGILDITFKYDGENVSVISGMKRVSKPGCRIYCNADSIPKVLGGMGIVVISTSKGILTGKKSEELGVGGEVLCQVW